MVKFVVLEFYIFSQSKFPRDQIFVGIVTLQYQPRKDVLRLIDALDAASIRFVHFSPDGEFQSRVSELFLVSVL